ncbi:fatty acid CoA ligase family protein [Tundrisphaera sp. TA3]|uniref:fatty acid CoA ligase family protein n=1 Tax=Tundrisphaera sp. TA3 TaxID=3435775 RepID=UPI003EB95FBC
MTVAASGVAAGNIAAGLPAMARERPHALAVLAPSGRDHAGRARHTHRTFLQLDRDSDAIAAGLVASGIGPGVRTVLMVRPSLEFFALTFGLFKAGAVPVLVDPGLGIRNLGPCLAQAEPAAFIGIPAAQAARQVLRWGRETIRTVVTVGRRWPGGGPTLDDVIRRGEGHPAPMDDPGDDATAAILFTSGSTGPPKGVVYTHAIFRNQVAILRDLYQIRPGEVDLCTFPLFALFGPALGMTCVVPEMDFTRPGQADPTKIIGAIEDFGVTNLFGSPALIRRVGIEALRGVRLPSLRRVISAGAPVPARVLETFGRMLDPEAKVYTPYGATESLPVCSIEAGEILGETRYATETGAGVCVGRPAPGMRVEIIRIDDGPIAAWSDDLLVPDGTVGEIVASGPVVTRSYFQRPEATDLAKIDDPASGTFRHRMGDLGYRDEQGRIWFCGRKAHRVETADGALYSVACEGIFNAASGVARTALVGVGPRGAMRPVLCFEATPSRPYNELTRARREEVEAELRAIGAQHAMTRGIQTFLPHPGFPVDIRHNAKINREALAAWAARRLP